MAFPHCVLWISALALLLTMAGGAAFADDAAAPVEPEAPLIVDGELDLERAITRFEDLYRSTSSVAEMELTIVKPRRTQRLQMKTWTLGRDKALIVVQEPPRDRGTATLKVDDNLWNYLPRIKRTIRIPPSMLTASWMGSDFTNDDLVRESSFLDDYTYELVGRSESPPGWEVRFEAKPDLVGLWSRFDLIMSEDGEIPLAARYYDRKGQLARILEWDDVREMDGRRLPTRMTLTPQDEEGQQTIMTYLSLDFDVDVPESTFSLMTLEQQR